MKKYLILAVILLACGLIMTLKVLHNQKEEKRRYKANFEVSQTDLEIEKTKSGQLSARVDFLELNNSELKNEFSRVNETLKDMSIRLKELQTYNATSTETVYNINTQFKDSVINDTTKLEYLDYKTAWIDLQVYKIDADAKVDLVVRDSLTTVVYWQRPHKFLFFRWGRKEYSQKITSANPHTRIIYSESIMPRRK